MRVREDIETPAVVVDADRLERNLDRMAAAAAAAGVVLRPHAKTHKSAEIARMQLARGAAGLTVATLAEAEAFAAAGCPSVLVAYPLWAQSNDRPERIVALQSVTDLRIGVDSVPAAEALAAAAPGARVLIEIDSGQHRTGVAAAEAGTLAAACQHLGLDVLGAFTHPGHSYGGPDAVAAAVADEQAALSAAGAALAGMLDQAPELSGGSSPTAFAELTPVDPASAELTPVDPASAELTPVDPASMARSYGYSHMDGTSIPSDALAGKEDAMAGSELAVTELRPGTYVFGDRQQMHLSGLTADDIALVVAARVVSVPRPGEAVLDAGSKALTSDRADWLTGHGLILEAPEATIASLSEEHAVVHGLRDSRLSVGDLVRVVPNHVCPVVNLTGSLIVVRDGEIVDRWPTVARR